MSDQPTGPRPEAGTLLPTHRPSEVKAIELRWKRGEITPAEAHELVRKARRGT